jgi:glyoxylase-like metal-dependent hydrolase (beta-lactamase superfamily II)
MPGPRIDKVVTSGVFTLDGGTWAVDNNVWLVGDGEECVVIDAAHDAEAIAAAVAGRRVVAIVCTHAHNDHVNAAPAQAHAPGACCLYSPQLGTVFTGDTLFAGGPGATGRSYSDFDTIIGSIRARLLLPLDPRTRVCTGHGEDTTIGTERPHLEEWIKRGH